MLNEYFYIDGESNNAAGIHLQKTITFSAPTHKMETVTVPGRNGTLHFYENAFENVTGEAACFILEKTDVDKALMSVSKWVLQKTGYHRLEVSNEPTIFRMAAISTGPETDIRMRTLAPFTLEFDCKPQKFLRSGERKMILTQKSTTINNQGMPSKPLIIAYGEGEGSITIGGTVVTLKKTFSGLTLDCETMNAYSGTMNKNADIDAPVFPEIPSGESVISWTGGVTKLEVIPRWWLL